LICRIHLAVNLVAKDMRPNQHGDFFSIGETIRGLVANLRSKKVADSLSSPAPLTPIICLILRLLRRLEHFSFFRSSLTAIHLFPSALAKRFSVRAENK
jgi:hypothetical protein